MKYVILGAGAAGITFANTLLNYGEKDFVVLEQEDSSGGLCKSVDVDGFPLDVGGGHFLDVANKTVTNFVFSFMPRSEWNLFCRDSKIFIHNQFMNSPFEANIYQLPLDMQIDYLKSIAVAGCNLNKKMPKKFVDWIYWKLGEKIAADYMIPYNQKMFGSQLNNLGTYWLNKLPNVSFEETMKSCLQKKPHGLQPAHAKFFYPKKHGYGEVFNRMAEKIKSHIKYNTSAKKIDLKTKTVNDCYKADYIICTVPWTSLEVIKFNGGGVDFSSLKYTSIDVAYKKDVPDTKAHWIYFPEEKLTYHRILMRNNFLEKSCGCWTETNTSRTPKSDEKNIFRNKYAYPLNTLAKPKIMQQNLSYLEKYNVYGLGRWGEWQHYNSDVVILRAIELAKKLVYRS